MTPLYISTVLNSAIFNIKKQVKQVSLLQKGKALTNTTKLQKPEKFLFKINF